MNHLHVDFLPCSGARPGAAEHLVMLPGWGMPSAAFGGLIPALQQHFHLSLIDLPGAGTNANVELGGSVLSMAAAVLDAAPLYAHFLGWSLGGMVAACIAANEPQRVQSLVTVASNLSFVQRTGWPAAMPEDVFMAFVRDVDADAPAALGRFLGLQCQGALAAREDLRQLRAALATHPLPSHDALLDGLAVLREADLRPLAESIRCPSQWIFCEHDALVPAAAADVVLRRVPNAHVAMLSGAAHAPFFSSLPPLLSQLAEGVLGSAMRGR